MGKKIVIIVVVFIILLVTGVIMLKKFKGPLSRLGAVQPVNELPAARDQKSADNESATVSQKEIRGKVLSIAEKTISIEKKDGQETLNINAGTPVSVLRNGKIEKSSLYAVKTLMSVKVAYDSITKNVLAILIEKP